MGNCAGAGGKCEIAADAPQEQDFFLLREIVLEYSRHSRLKYG